MESVITNLDYLALYSRFKEMLVIMDLSQRGCLCRASVYMNNIVDKSFVCISKCHNHQVSVKGWQYWSVCRSSSLFQSEISLLLQVAIKCCKHILQLNYNGFGDPITFLSSITSRSKF